MLKILSNKRKCNECTKCCEGWTTGEVYGHKYFPGRKCYFLGKNCTIYKNRPKKNCVDYWCGWIKNPELFPEWLKPSLSNIIIHQEEKENIKYFVFIYAGKELTVEILQWILEFSLKNNINVKYSIHNNYYKIGSEEFVKGNF